MADPRLETPMYPHAQFFSPYKKRINRCRQGKGRTEAAAPGLEGPWARAIGLC